MRKQNKAVIDPWIAWLGDHHVELKKDIMGYIPISDPEEKKEPDSDPDIPEPIVDDPDPEGGTPGVSIDE